MTAKKRFLAKLRLTDTGCMEWSGYRNHGGYGVMTVEGKRVRSHRYSYQLFHGEIPANLVVMHSCDNPSCCNPEHLVAGTHKNNSADKVDKRRHAFGGKNGGAKLTEAQVYLLRDKYSRGEATGKELAIEFGIAKSTAHKIINREIWSHL